MNRYVMMLFFAAVMLSSLYPQTKGQADLSGEMKAVMEKVEQLEADLLEYKQIYRELYENFYNERKEIMEKDFETFKKENSISGRIASIAGMVALLGCSLTAVLNFIFRSRKQLNLYADKKIKEELDKIFLEKKEFLLKLIKEQSDEQKLKKEKKILVISDIAENYRDEVQNLLLAYGFENFDFRSIRTDLSRREADLVLINNYKMGIEDPASIIKDLNPRVPVIHFLDGKDPVAPADQPPLYIRANSLHTLYPRMIELLTYKQAMGSAK